MHLLFIYLVMLLLSGIRIWESNEVKVFDTINFSVNTILLIMILVMPSVGHVFPESETVRILLSFLPFQNQPQDNGSHIF